MSLKLYLFSIFLVNQIIIAATEETIEEFKNMVEAERKKLKEFKEFEDNQDFKGAHLHKCISAGTYDFVIVGAGSSGAVISSRLSENPNWSILLLETGRDENNFTLIPAYFPENLKSYRVWNYYTTPQKGCKIYKNSRCEFPTGKILGGGSAINGMMWVRGNAQDYNRWGLKEWSYEKVLPYFKKSENSSGIILDEDYHGISGPIRISKAEPKPELLEEILEANEFLGCTRGDYNGALPKHTSQVQTSVDRGRRCSTNQAYLKKKLNNLTIITEALAVKIVFKSRVVVGLKYIYKKKCYFVRIRKELILSAGVANSAQLLLLSGIGPKADLAKLRIPIIKNLPVGKHLEEHPIFYPLQIATNQTHLESNNDEIIRQYLNGTGLLTQSIGLILAFYNINTSENYPDLEFIFGHDRSKKFLEIPVSIVLLHPRSSGWIKLVSKNYADFPLINPGFLKHPDDITSFKAGIRLVLEMIKTPAFKKIGAKLDVSKLSACDGFKKSNDLEDEIEENKYWDCLLMHYITGASHGTGTCRMGLHDIDSVVDQDLKVHGVEKLRIADSSVVPKSISGHMNSVAIMIGEMISDVIKRDYDSL